MVHLLARVRPEERAQRLVVPAKHVLPRVVADRLDEIRRAADVGEHERPDCALRLCGPAEKLAGTASVRARAEPVERALCGAQLQLGPIVVSVRPIGPAEVEAGPRGLVRKLDLGPELDGAAQRADRVGGLPAGERELAVRGGSRRRERGRAEVLRCSVQLLDVGTCLLEVLHRERDLDGHGQKPRAPEGVVRLVEGTPKAASRGIRLALGETEERSSRLRVAPELVRLLKGLLRSLLVAKAEPDLPDLVHRLSGRDEVEALDLHERSPRLFLGLGPRAAETDDARSLDAADSGEARDRLPLAPLASAVRPVAGAPVLRELVAHGDRVAVDDGGRVRLELAAHRGRRRLVDERPPLVQGARGDEEPALEVKPQGLEVAISVAPP